jgi:hypothetical protein
VTPEKVTKSYEGSEQFLLSVGKTYLLEAATAFWGIEKLDDQPTEYVPPAGIAHMTKEKKKEYFNLVIGKFVDEYIIPDPEKENELQRKSAKEGSFEADRVR